MTSLVTMMPPQRRPSQQHRTDNLPFRRRTAQLIPNYLVSGYSPQSLSVQAAAPGPVLPDEDISRQPNYVVRDGAILTRVPAKS